MHETRAHEPIDREVRLAIYTWFVDHGRAPADSEIATRAGLAIAEVRPALERLAAARILVLEPSSRALWMAMPFSAVPTDFRVRWSGGSACANCAWDALGIPALVGADAEIDAVDPVNGGALQLRVRNGDLEPTGFVVHFAVPAAEWWRDIGFT